MKTSIQIYNRIKALRAEQSAVPADADNRAEQMFALQGQITEAEIQLAEVLDAEEAVRTAGAAVGAVASAQASIAEQAFGPRAAFKGITAGFRAAVTLPAGPKSVDPSIPGFVVAPRGFADTLIQAPTEGAVTFLRRKAKTNAAGQWKTADGAKGESAYEWEEATAPLTWIAHSTPIAKTQASDWGQLDAIIRSEMMLGLAQAKGIAAISGANAAGITGVANTVGIQTHTTKAGDNVYDSIRRMATKVYLVSGFVPTHVVMSPQVKEELDLLKGEDGHYLTINVGGQVWGLEIVLDTGLTAFEAAVGTHNSAIVYASVGATWYTKEQDNVEIGLVNDQFIKNAYTLLAEGRNAMAVRFPDAFCYCQNAIAVVPV